MEELNEPVYSTSVNRGSDPPLTAIEDIRATFGERVDLTVEGEMPPKRLPSTIVDYSQRRPVLVRQGSYVWTGGGKPSN